MKTEYDKKKEDKPYLYISSLDEYEVDDFIQFIVRGVMVGFIISFIYNSIKHITHYYTNLFDEKMLI